MYTMKNGKRVSDETTELAIKEYFVQHPEEKKSLPMITICSFSQPNDRAIIRLPGKVIERVKAGAKVVVLSLTHEDCIGDKSSDRLYCFSLYDYSSQQTFGKVTK